MAWQPGCELEALKRRANLLSTVRRFFSEKAVLEVDTPLLSHSSVTDLHLASVTAQLNLPGYTSVKNMYLQTSPEFAMKRLLASGSGSIYQIAKCFRDGERGKRHNPEFTMLEWYRPDFKLQDLMDEVAELLLLVANLPAPEKITYQQAFQRYLNINPHKESDENLSLLAKEKTGICGDDLSRDDCLDLLLTHCIEPKLGCDKPVFMTEYPASQASLAKVKERDGVLLAQRFELYVNGLELANGYDELVDADEQLQRFEADNEARKAHDLPEIPVDYNLVEALKSGLPECSGVALGLDRLQMVIQGAKCIDEVISFAVERA